MLITIYLKELATPLEAQPQVPSSILLELDQRKYNQCNFFGSLGYREMQNIP